MRRLALALSALLLCLGGPAFAGTDDDAGGGAQLRNARMVEELRTRAKRFGVSSYGLPETTYVGVRAGQSANYWKIGVGPYGYYGSTDGAWTFETPIHGDSLQGWWPIRQAHTNATGAILIDVNRPWWAIEIGNQANYVMNERRDLSDPAAPGNRTFGVVGVWHSDPGNTAAGAGKGVAWTPLSGTRSAWMGLRRHGDATVSDSITGNPFNADVLMFNGINGASSGGSVGTSKKFPGYGSQMDQMLYRDIDVSGTNAGLGVTLTFKFATTMSTGKNTVAATRTGWFDGDPIKVPGALDGNFISAEAGSTPNALAPVDSFEVYIGAPAESAFVASDGLSRPIYDPLRRWFNEVLKKAQRKWLFGRAGNNSAQIGTVAISAAEKAALQSNGILRAVFRVHTNRGFDDEGIAYSSGSAGAVQLDDVSVDLGSGPSVIGDFEGTTAANDINDDPSVPASQAWKSTGKPPGIFFHTHALFTLPWADLCGPPGTINSGCKMWGTVVSMGDHDNLEAAGGSAGSADASGNWSIMSPTINLVTSGSWVPNNCDLTGNVVNGAAEIYNVYDIYTGIFDVFTQGNFWWSLMQSYPAKQSDGVPAWGEIRVGSTFFSPDAQCFQNWDPGRGFGMIVTSNPSNIPDSIRIGILRSQQCYRFGITTGCSPTDGAYLDNMSLALVSNTPPPLSVPIGNWINDTFPFNEVVPPSTVAFDTTSALIRTGLNITEAIGTMTRFDVPGDSTTVHAVGDSLRVDLVFRVSPGPGNYVTLGNRASGLRRLPTGTAAIAPGDGSFWSVYKADPGEFATPGATAKHAAASGGWSALAWNSARIDTADANLFPLAARGINSAVDPTIWMSTYHELDSHFAALGVSHPRCFLIDTLGFAREPNIVCSGVLPAWVMTVPQSRTGYNGNPNTTEGTSVFPDGIFTPGTHVEYFIRRVDLKGPTAGTVTLLPDTTVVYPQVLEGSLDGHRWQQFSVLPDRWKDAAYGGAGLLCMLVVDADDRGGDELAWVSIADSIGATSPSNYGAHNGWHAAGGADVNDPAGFVSRNAQPGTSWDLFGIKGGENPTLAAGTLGSRGAYHDPSISNKVNGKYSVQGPTLAMLMSYYQILMILSGDLSSGILGPIRDRSQNDVGLLEQFMNSGTTVNPVGVFVAGDGFAASEADGGTHEALMTDYFGMDIRDDFYMRLSSNNAITFDFAPFPVLNPSSLVYGMRNRCFTRDDVLNLNPGVAEAMSAADYPNFGAAGPYHASVYKPSVPVRPWVSLVDGFDIRNLVTRFGDTTKMRASYFFNLFATGFSPACTVNGVPVSVFDTPDTRHVLTDFAAVLGNPLRSGFATVRFRLAAADRAEIRMFDVAGRKVRTLAERNFPAGEHSLTWDGTDDAGRPVARGVYFTHIRYHSRGFDEAKRIIVLK